MVTACMTPQTCVISATDNVCGACGASGQVCCGTGNNGTCNAALACVGRNAGMRLPGMCGPCGAAGQACCPVAGGGGADAGVTACVASLACLVGATGNECGTCGAAGEACCGTGANGTCNAGLGCTGRNRNAAMAGTCGVIPDAGTADAPAGG